jgi:hypothetical protein
MAGGRLVAVSAWVHARRASARGFRERSKELIAKCGLLNGCEICTKPGAWQKKQISF